jgi:uncharacterized protein
VIAHCYKALTVAVAGMAVFLISCQSAPTRLFALDPIAPTSIASPYNGPTIRVDAVHIPPGLDRIEILSEVGSGEFKASDRDHWMAPLGQLARQALTEDLIARLPQGRVIFPDLPKATGTISVSVDLLAFSADRAGAKLHVSWIGTSDGSEPRSYGGIMLLETTLPSAGSAATASALSTLLAELADRIVADLLLLAPVEQTS